MPTELYGTYPEFRSRIQANGPWDDEPDEVLWFDEKTGLPCILRRGPWMHWCGYVGAPSHLKCNEDNLRVHGGITGSINTKKSVPFVWAVALPSVDWENTQWFGFDCCHYGDLAPGYSDDVDYWNACLKEYEYRDKEYVMNECRELAYQIRRIMDGEQ